MAAILTAEDVVPRIAAECAYVDERGGVDIRLEPAAAIVRRLQRAVRPGHHAAGNRAGHQNRRHYCDLGVCFFDRFQPLPSPWHCGWRPLEDVMGHI
jgi:hypothetical protein